MATVELDDSELRARLVPALETALRGAAEGFVAHVRADVGTAYPPASAPGQPPHRRTGRLQRSIDSAVGRDGGDVVLQVGASAVSPRGFPYPQALEWGTRRMAPRPFLSARFATDLRALEADIVERLRVELGSGE